MLACDWFFSTLLFSLSSLFAFHQMATTKIQNQKRVPESLKKQLALAVRSIQWSYAIFWTISDTQPGYSKFLFLSVLAYPCSASLLFLLKYIHFSFEQGYKMNKHSKLVCFNICENDFLLWLLFFFINWVCLRFKIDVDKWGQSSSRFRDMLACWTRELKS